MLRAADGGTARESARTGRGALLAASTDGVPVLVVDDDPNFCASVDRVLAATPLRPLSVATGTDAFRFLAGAAPFEGAPRPAFVVLDFNLPDLNAPAMLARLRADPLHCTLPVLVLSQISGRGDERAVLAAGAQAYHMKPSLFTALRDLLLDFWRTHGGPHGHPGR